MDTDVQVVITEMRSGFNALNQRVSELKDDTREDAQAMHAENKARLVRIEDQVRATNGRVTAAESDIRGLWARLKEVGRKYSPTDGEGLVKSLTLPDLKWYLVCVGGGFSACYALLKLMGKL